VRFYDGLRHRVDFEKCPLEEASKARRTFDEEMEAGYPQFGLLPERPKRHRHDADGTS
jgi:hypothetical protein